MVRVGSVDHQANTVSDIFKRFETFVQIFDQLWQLVSPGLTNVALIYDEDYFDMLVNIQ